MIDKKYCMSSYLMYRTIVDEKRCFKEGWIPNLFKLDFPRIPVYKSEDLEQVISERM